MNEVGGNMYLQQAFHVSVVYCMGGYHEILNVDAVAGDTYHTVSE